MHDRGISCGFGSVANEKIENGNVSKDRETSTVSKNLQAKSVCNHVYNPLCNTMYNCVATGTRPLPGLLDHRTFEKVKVELGRCTICDTGRAAYRSREAQTNICQGCYARLVWEWNQGRGCGDRDRSPAGAGGGARDGRGGAGGVAVETWVDGVPAPG